jgi:hypothetical protein
MRVGFRGRRYALLIDGCRGERRLPASGQPAIRLDGAGMGSMPWTRHKPGGCNGGAQRVPLPRWCCITTHILRSALRPMPGGGFEQRKGRIDRIGQLAAAIDILNLRYRGSVEDEVHSALSSRLQQIRSIFGTIPDTLEDVWVATALGKIEEARRRIGEVPSRHPFDLRYAQDLPETAWERCVEVLDHYDVLRIMKQPW